MKRAPRTTAAIPASPADARSTTISPSTWPPKSVEPFGRLEHHPLGVLVGGGRGEHEHVLPARRGQQPRVEGASGGPFVPADQGQHAVFVHGPLLHAPPAAPTSTAEVTDR